MEKRSKGHQTVGLDLGDRFSYYVVLEADGRLVEEGRVATCEAALRERFSGGSAMRIALETGTHSPWVSRLLEQLGHQVVVANSRKLRLIYSNPKKNDRVDASYLARVARLDPALLSPVRHRSLGAQKDLALLRSRDALVTARTQLINHVRGAVKSFGSRLPVCSSGAFARKAAEKMPQPLRCALTPVLEQIASLNDRIRQLARELRVLAEKDYPESRRLRQVAGVGPITSLAFVLTLEDPRRFARSRGVAAFLGLTPGRKQSGGSDPQRRITKCGDRALRALLVNAAHYIVGPFGPDSDLRRFGLRLAARGGKNGRKRAIVAVARKLSILLHRLWRSAEVYDPLYREHQGFDRSPKAAWQSIDPIR